MSTVVFVPSGASPSGVINVAGSGNYDVAANLASGSGSITVDSIAQQALYQALLNFPGLRVSGTTPGTPSVLKVIAAVKAYVGNPQTGDYLVRGADGIFAPSQVSPSGVELSGDLGGTNSQPVVETVLGGLTPGTLDNTSRQPIAQSPLGVVSVASGSSPGALGWKTLPQDATYVLSVVGNGVGAINTKTGNTDFSVSSGDHAPVVQEVISALLNTSGPSAGHGGKISFDGNLQFASQLTVYPNIFLCGAGPVGYQAGGIYYGPTINSTFNGSCIVITSDSRLSTFPALRDFAIYGAGTGVLTNQNGIEWNASGGSSVKDTLLQGILVFHMGASGYLIGGAAVKILAEQCYCEFAGTDGITHTGSNGYLQWLNGHLAGNTGCGYNGGGSGSDLNVYFQGTSIDGNTGVGVIPANGASTFEISGGSVDDNAGGGLVLPTSVGTMKIATSFNGNGGGSTPTLSGSVNSTLSRLYLNSTFTCVSGAVINHVVLAGSNAFRGRIEGAFDGSSGPAVVWTSKAANQFSIKATGYNDVMGKIATPFSTAAIGRIGACGTLAAPTASTAYATEGTDIMLAVSGGTGVSITITDSAANTVQSGLTSYSGVLPIGYSINFGAFSVAPTVYAGVV